MKKIISIILLVCMVMVCTTSCDFFDVEEKEANAIMVKTPPTVTSKYGEPLAIKNDGVLYVKTVENEIIQVRIKLSMIDQTDFDNTSLEEQTLKINYGGKTTGFIFKLTRPAESVTLKKAPTVTSFTDMPLAIADDGILEVVWQDKTKEEIPVTLEMLDLTNFDMTSTATQTVPINYGGKTLSFSVALTIEQIANSGTLNTVRFEAEDAEYGGDSWVGVEDCQGQYREDGSQEKCVKGLHQTNVGGFVILNIVSDKKTEATIKISISKQTGENANYDEYTRFSINGEVVKTGIVLDNTTANGWWDFVTYEITTTVILNSGVNVIRIDTNDYAGTGAVSLSGRNINWIEIDSYSECSWYVE